MSYEEDVRFVGAFVRGGDWEVGLRIARNVDVDSGHGGKRVELRVSLRQFARDAGISDKTAAKYLAAWMWAAEDGIVPAPSELAEDDEFDFRYIDWSDYYAKACDNPPPWNTSAGKLEPRKGTERHVGRKTLIDGIADDPTLVADAIKSDPDVARAASKALDEKLDEKLRKQRETITCYGEHEQPAPLGSAIAGMDAVIGTMERSEWLNEVLVAAMSLQHNITRGLKQYEYTGDAADIEKVQQIQNVLTACAFAFSDGFVVESAK